MSDVPPKKLPESALVPVAVNPPRTAGLRLQHIMFAVVVCGVLFWVGIVAGLWLVTGSMVILSALIIGLAVVLARWGSTQQESLLWALAIASEKSMPLSPAAVAFADQYGAGFRWRTHLLADLLEKGMPLPEAIDEVPAIVSREAKVLIRAGWSTGTLPEALKFAATARTRRQAAWGNAAASLSYVAAVLFSGQVIVGFIMYFIIPKFEAIFKDFGIPLPGLTIFTIEVSHFVIQGGVGLLLLGMAELLLLIFLLLGVFNLFSWDAPLLDWLFRRRHASLLMRALSLTVSGDKPIQATLGALSESYPSGFIRRRLREATEAIRGGSPWFDALRKQGLLTSSDVAVLSSAERAGNLPWALREAADATERRLGYRLQFALELLFPVLIVGVGIVVGTLAVAYFLPLVTLIQRLS